MHCIAIKYGSKLAQNNWRSHTLLPLKIYAHVHGYVINLILTTTLSVNDRHVASICSLLLVCKTNLSPRLRNNFPQFHLCARTMTISFASNKEINKCVVAYLNVMYCLWYDVSDDIVSSLLTCTHGIIQTWDHMPFADSKFILVLD